MRRRRPAKLHESGALTEAPSFGRTFHDSSSAHRPTLRSQVVRALLPRS